MFLILEYCCQNSNGYIVESIPNPLVYKVALYLIYVQRYGSLKKMPFYTTFRVTLSWRIGL